MLSDPGDLEVYCSVVRVAYTITVRLFGLVFVARGMNCLASFLQDGKAQALDPPSLLSCWFLTMVYCWPWVRDSWHFTCNLRHCPFMYLCSLCILYWIFGLFVCLFGTKSNYVAKAKLKLWTYFFPNDETTFCPSCASKRVGPQMPVFCCYMRTLGLNRHYHVRKKEGLWCPGGNILFFCWVQHSVIA